MTYLQKHCQIISLLVLTLVLFIIFATGLVPEEHRILVAAIGIAVTLLLNQLAKDLSHRIES